MKTLNIREILREKNFRFKKERAIYILFLIPRKFYPANRGDFFINIFWNLNNYIQVLAQISKCHHHFAKFL